MVSIVKNTNSQIKFKIYDDFQTRNPVDLSVYHEFICAVTENGQLILEKKFSTNDILIINDGNAEFPYIVQVNIKKEDTQNVSINPSTEERIRTLELFGVSINEVVTRFLVTDFYLEGSGYYVRRNRN